MKKKGEKGFFVVETIVVIAIVSIVITYVFVNFSNTYNRFIVSETYNNINATNAVLNLKEYVDNCDIDFSATLDTKDYLELSSITKVSSSYYNKLKEYLKIKTAYLINTENFFSNANNMNSFDIKFQNYLDTLSIVKSKYIIVIELENLNYGYISIYNYNLELVGDSDKDYVTYVKVGDDFIEPGYTAEDKNGKTLDVYITGFVDTSIEGTYYLTYTLQDIISRRKVVVYEDVYDYDYTGNYQVFRVPVSGTYKVELWGASGGKPVADTTASKGGYSTGEIYLNEGDTLYLYVGQAGSLGTYGVNATSTVGQGGIATFNGGGAGGNAGGSITYPYANYKGGPSGGGATDIRYLSGTWDNSLSLRSRVMVAGGGGGFSSSDAGYDAQKGNSGGLTGQNGAVDAYLIGAYEGDVINRGVGATQTTGNLFGIGERGDNTGTSTYCNGHAGGGGGYYGGTGGTQTGGNCHIMGGGAGSSFISGYAGVNAIRVDGTHSGTTKHFSGYVFDNMVMYSGTQTFLSPAGVNETGHTGNGYARISLIDPNQSNTLSKVRYIYNEMNGSTSNQSSHWVELQAYDINGNNVSQGVTTITNNYLGAVDLTRLTNGNVATAEYIEGGIGVSFVMLDLGKEYDLSTIRLWHYYGDGRTYYDNIVKVAGNDELFRVVLDEEYPETSHGKIIRPESID